MAYFNNSEITSPSTADLSWAAHVKARRALIEEETFLDLESARMDFQRLMADLISEELSAIPELPKMLTELGISHYPALANFFSTQKDSAR